MVTCFCDLVFCWQLIKTAPVLLDNSHCSRFVSNYGNSTCFCQLCLSSLLQMQFFGHNLEFRSQLSVFSCTKRLVIFTSHLCCCIWLILAAVKLETSGEWKPQPRLNSVKQSEKKRPVDVGYHCTHTHTHTQSYIQITHRIYSVVSCRVTYKCRVVCIES